MEQQPESPRDEFREAVVSGIKGAVSRKLGHAWWAMLLRGIIAVLIGLYCLFNPALAIAMLVWAFGLYLIIDGILGLVAAFQVDDKLPLFLQAVVSLLAGATLFLMPGLTLAMLFLILGVWLVIGGIGQILGARKSEEGMAGALFGTAGLTVVLGLILIFWPVSGLQAAGILLGIIILALGLSFLFIAMRLRGAKTRLENAGR